MVEEAETEDVMKGLDKLVHKLDVKAAVSFMLIDVKDKSASKQWQPCNICYEKFMTVNGLLV